MVHMGFPPYHVLATPTMSAEDIAECIRWLERRRGVEFYTPVAPAFRDPVPGLTGFIDLRIRGSIEAARTSPERLANSITILAGDDVLARPNRLAAFGRWLLKTTPSSLVQLVLETDAPLPADLLDLLAEAFHDPAHYLNRARHLDDDPQGRASIRLFRLTADARASDRARKSGETCDLILRWPARPAGLARKLLRDRPFLLAGPDLGTRERQDLLRLYCGHENLLLEADRAV
jgi:hypothetical protein